MKRFYKKILKVNPPKFECYKCKNSYELKDILKVSIIERESGHHAEWYCNTCFDNIKRGIEHGWPTVSRYRDFVHYKNL